MRRAVAYALLLLSLTLWAYASVWSAEWVYEDRAARTSAMQATGDWFSQRSVSAWTWRLTPTPRAAHALNLTLHLVIGGLVGLVAWRLGLTPLGAWAAATVWLLHPMAVEVAAYAKARGDAIALVGVLLAALAATGRWWRGWSLVGIVLGSLLAIGGKQAGGGVLLLVPLVIWHGRDRHVAPRWAPWWMPSLVAAALIIGGVQWYGGLHALINADGDGMARVIDVTWAQWLFVQAGAVWYWALASLWPALITPDADIDRLSTLTRLSGLCLLAGAAVVAWQMRTQAPVLSLSCAWVVLGVLPRLLVQTPRSYLNAAQFAVAFVGMALLAGLAVERAKAQFMSDAPLLKEI